MNPATTSAPSSVGEPATSQFFTLPGGILIRKKWASLSLLIVQTTTLVLLMRFSRVDKPIGGTPRYMVGAAVVAAEALKILTSLFLLHYQSSASSWSETFSFLSLELKHSDTLKLSVPGMLYLIQNNLLFIALSNLEAAIYQVTYQLKILTTALFSVTMLGKSLSVEQIFALFLLMIGVALVQLSELSASSAAKDESQNAWLGLACVLLASLSSGFAGVYLEKVMKKGRPVSLWLRNIQLGIFGVIFGLLTVFASPNDRKTISEHGFFVGFTSIVWLVVVIQAAGGLLIAAVIQYADNILKGFATSVSIVVSSLISVWLFDFKLHLSFVVGASLVVVAVLIYGSKDGQVKSPSTKPQSNDAAIASIEKKQVV